MKKDGARIMEGGEAGSEEIKRMGGREEQMGGGGELTNGRGEPARYSSAASAEEGNG